MKSTAHSPRRRAFPSRCCCLAWLVLTAPAWADNLPPAEVLEREGAVIGEIEIDNADIFDLSIPEENRFLYRLANKLNIVTKPWVIKRQLLFKTGDPYQERLLQESERILRSNTYINTATVEPVRYHDGKVDILVRTVDVWTLDPRLGFSRTGGSNSATIGIRESNLLGRGLYFSLHARTNVDRDSNEIKFSDRQLGRSWYGASLSYADNSDGKRFDFKIGKPFYALSSQQANGIFWLDEDRTDSLYDRGEIQASFGHELNQFDGFYGWSKGLVDGWAHRFSAGMSLLEDRFYAVEANPDPAFLPPPDRKFVYPYLKWEMIEDRFEEASNHDQIGLIEDRYLGAHYSARVGFAPAAFGSGSDAWLLEASLSRGFGRSGADSLLTELDFHTRVEPGGARDLQLFYRAIYHHRRDYGGLFHAALSGSLGKNLDIDNPLQLGGDSGLRGYPLRYQGGESSMLVTLEERWYSDWFPFRLVRVGGAMFFDVGRTWGENPVGAENLGWLKDAGVGLRIGNARSGIGSVLHIDLAFPLDGGDGIDKVQILFEGKTSF